MTTICPAAHTTTFVVQTDPVPGQTVYPLPTDYWSRPVNSQLSSWGALLSNWLYTPPAVVNNLQPSGPGPLTSHIMWTQHNSIRRSRRRSLHQRRNKIRFIPRRAYTFYEGMSYEERNISPIIMGGYLYYELPLSHQATGGGYVCVDLRTGQQLWKQNYTVNPTFGQLYGYDTINQHGVHSKRLAMGSKRHHMDSIRRYDRKLAIQLDKRSYWHFEIWHDWRNSEIHFGSKRNIG